MHDGVTSAESTSCCVNPLTALGMVEAMRLENHSALVHTAAASNLGQMLIKICLDEDLPLVNIVRKEEHVDMLNGLGAKVVCNSSKETFMQDLVSALVETGATIGFDATGGGELTGQILTCMEIAARKYAQEVTAYGSTNHKQVYIYGALNQ